jgi:predicted N-acyltransferase
LQRFDPGAQGEHKIQRGFQSVETCSYHWINDLNFRNAIADFCRKEIEHNQFYVEDARQYLPFKEDTKTVNADILINN